MNIPDNINLIKAETFIMPDDDSDFAKGEKEAKGRTSFEISGFMADALINLKKASPEKYNVIATNNSKPIENLKIIWYNI